MIQKHVLGTGTGSHGPMAQPTGWPVCTRLADTGSHLDERLLGYITKILTVDHSGYRASLESATIP